ncbi:uncharacterized protein LOC119111613 [Pollicipes pollicipes]|uniref:uncharacterized protein LOC119111613 n=1 Tax=Pollicipes pollicipes TaxID=41117 RepID=UPI0018849791|nr:uncharacterized protein LOC119111613 [Pollicipes pollicipes]
MWPTGVRQVPCEKGCSACGDADLLPNVELGLPFELVSRRLDGMVSCLQTKLALLTEREGGGVPGMQDPAVADGAQLVRELRQQLETAERTVLEQRQLIMGTTGPDDCDGSFQHNAFLLEEREELAMRERMLEEQRQALGREREMYTEAVLRLGRERVAFEEERAQAVRAQFLASSPLLSGESQGGRRSGAALVRRAGGSRPCKT